MAGWSKLEGCKTIHTVESSSSYEYVGSEEEERENKLKNSFAELITAFLEETSNGCSSNKWFQPVPPMLGNGHSVDLLKLYFVVKLKGGFDAISRKKLWDDVGLLYGLGPGFGSALKLIYLKYLDSIETWLVKLSRADSPKNDRFNTGVWSKGVLMALGTEYSNFVSNMMDEVRKSDDAYCLKEEKSGISFIDLTEDDNDNDNDNENENENGKLDWNKCVMSFGDNGGSSEENEEGGMKVKQDEAELSFADGMGFMGENHDDNLKQTKSEMSSAGVFSSDVSDDGRSSVDPAVADNVVKSSENSSDSKKCSNDNEELIMDSSVVKEVSSLKRKRDSFTGMLCWMANAARNPTDPEIGTIPESSKWGFHGTDKYWKQVLLAREALFSKKRAEQHVVFQKRYKMHPSMFDDERPRSSPRLIFDNLPKAPSVELSSITPGRPRQRLEARLDMKPTASIYTSRPQQRIPIGPDFQAVVPEWTGMVAESDSKWLGTRVWPLEQRDNMSLDESDPIGKGRESCGCLFPGTSECVRFHISKTRMKMKFELGSAFYSWKFDKMGEECSISWTADEEKQFKSVVKENPLSGQKCFWKKMCAVLPKKSWVDQVNYYFNVFVLRRRAFQNRHAPRNIDSDDDEAECGYSLNTLKHGAAESCSSILSSKKAHTKSK